MPSNVPGVYGNAIDMSAIYAQAAASAESLPAMWNPATGDTTAPQSKMVGGRTCYSTGTVMVKFTVPSGDLGVVC